MNRKFAPINNTLNKILQKYHLEEEYAFQNIKTHWVQIVDKNMNKLVKPVKLENKVLYLDAKTEYWKDELNSVKKDILETVNKNNSSYKIDDIKFI